jgi:hypothetical protein
VLPQSSDSGCSTSAKAPLILVLVAVIAWRRSKQVVDGGASLEKGEVEQVDAAAAVP